MRAFRRLARPSMLIAPCTLFLLSELDRAGSGRATPESEVENAINFYIERKRHIMPQQLKACVPQQMPNIVFGAGKRIIDANDIIAAFNQPIA